MKRIIAFFKKFFGKPATQSSPKSTAIVSTVPSESLATPVTKNPMRLKRGEKVNRTRRGFYRGYFGPVIRV
jgi:hypothetical protein